MKYKHLLICIFIILFSSCKSRSKVDDDDYSSSEYENVFYYEDLNSENKTFDDGIYSATVDYYNPETGYSNTYTLDVEVEDNAVVQINFPNGGWLDDDHITPEELDYDGNCTVEGENGKTYDIHIEE